MKAAISGHLCTSMENTMAQLPDYENPPVIEVAIGIQFNSLPDFTSAHLGLYWGIIRKEFAKVEEREPIAHVIELAEALPETPQDRFALSPVSIPPRIWFVNNAGEYLIQVQRDRYLNNWRKLAGENPYPRYPVVRDRFAGYWEEFKRFLADNHLQEPQPDQCELTYVNHIRKGEGWEHISQVGNLLTVFQWKTRTGFLPEPEALRWSLRFALPNAAGRLHVDLSPILIRDTKDRALRLTLTARGRPQDFGRESMLQWYDLAREYIVRGFADLAAEATDKLWGKLT